MRYLGHQRRSRHLSVLRTLDGAFTDLTLPTSGVVEVSVRYTDPYDLERASPWTTLSFRRLRPRPRRAGISMRPSRLRARGHPWNPCDPAAVERAGNADSYEVSACNYAPEAVNNSWVWATTDPSHPDHYAEHANCPYRLGGNGGAADQEGGLSTTDALGLSSGAAPGTSAGWTFTAPVGTTITAINYERYIGHQLDPFNDWSPALRADGTIIPSETCLDSSHNGETCFVGGPPGEGGEPGVDYRPVSAPTVPRNRLPSAIRRRMRHGCHAT